MKTAYFIAPLALLAGCSTTALVSRDYRGGDSVTVQVSGQHIHELDVRFHPTAPKAIVLPPASNRLGQSLAGRDNEWSANLAAYRLLYTEALQSQLSGKRGSCKIASDYAYPDFYMIEYVLSCQ